MFLRSTTLILTVLLVACAKPGADEIDTALDALREHRYSDAEAALARIDPAGDAEVVTLATFLRGNVAYARCEIATEQAQTPEAEPFAIDVAIGLGEAALDAWQRAAATRRDWPEARRNAERALIKLTELEDLKAKREGRPRREKRPNPRLIANPRETGGAKSEKETTAEAQENALTDTQVAALFEKLDAREREKISVRKSERTTSGVGRDW